VFARVIFAALDGLVLQQVFFGRPDETRAGIDELRSMLALIREQTGRATGRRMAKVGNLDDGTSNAYIRTDE
jgi:hypothetical protein